MKQQEIERLAGNISIDRAAINRDRILSNAGAALEAAQRRESHRGRTPSRGRLAVLVGAGGLAATLLIVTSWVAMDLRREVAGLKDELAQARRDAAVARQDVPPAQHDNTGTINLYLQEHRDVVARHASFGSAAPQPAQVHANQRDVMYYEFFDDEPEYMYPGIIVRAPSRQRAIGRSEAPVISNGHTLTLSEARKTAGFNLVARSWLHPGYKLDEIRRIYGRDALQLLYTDGINSVSLFEQPLDGQRGLEARDFREYAVYRNEEQAGGTILAWRDDERSYVLIGNTELSQLMDMAQSIGAAN